ncbi:hypothetical protein [Erythrobacter dokdonensis]|uniref:Uncharacterized protein n=1 Tax=Erythrobacter dokdonensis DSW-74 TaxID=1300349 RepID=A0A1A7BHS5_9SPHN|nr:hypothetical protein [Erythrobacter dokdonensis]OBV12034.1 hypothetical protein I603_0165 [Erythrobacter dokdonensis DSW-74]
MGGIIDQVYLTIISMVSLAFFGGLAFYIIHASNSRWREYELLYAAIEPRETKTRKLAGMLRISQPGFRWGHLSGDLKSNRHPPVMVGVHHDGLSLTIVPPFRYGCRDLFLPFDRMTIEPAAWDFSDRAFGIQMEGVDGIEIVMFANVMEWAAEHSDILALMLQRADLVRGLQRA